LPSLKIPISIFVESFFIVLIYNFIINMSESPAGCGTSE